MDVIPSVDILGGEVVRLELGDPARKTVYGDDPLSVAKEWAAQGATRLHVVDLDAALGSGDNTRAVEDVVRGAGVAVQVAGGIRTFDRVHAFLDAGADRIVIGTAALSDPSFLERAVDVIGARLVVAPDARGGRVQIAGWTKDTGEDVVIACERLADAGVARLLVTDIGKDGMLSGPNVSLLTEVAVAAKVPVIASGGVSSIDDLRELAAVAGIEGAIVGKALYDGRLSLADALGAVA